MPHMRGMPRKTDHREGDKPDDWRALAACRAYDPEIWFPIGDKAPSDIMLIQTAVSICHGCPVRFECLEDVLRSGDRFGVRAAFTERERQGTHPDTLRRRAHETPLPDRPDRVVGRLQASCA